ncbi:hypothetical protein BDZ89DRAFT_1061278 [Hymenopellis radicata]|nr:hypothetical protein BDZ89DRAFT_1061278 [Hymenopellis radicata]
MAPSRLTLRASNTPPPKDASLTQDAKIALISGIVAGIAGIILGIFVIRAVLRNRRNRNRRREAIPRLLGAHYSSGGHARNQSTMEHLIPDGPHRREDSQGYVYETTSGSYISQSWSDTTTRYSRAYLPRAAPYREPSVANDLVPVRSMSGSMYEINDAFPIPSSPPERRSMHSSPKCLPRLIIPNAAVVPKSAVAVSVSNSEPVPAGGSAKSSASAYSQTSAGSVLPPVPPVPDYIVVNAHASEEGAPLGRADTVAIASLLQERAQRMSGVSRAASHVSRIERWDSVKHGNAYLPESPGGTLLPPPESS